MSNSLEVPTLVAPPIRLRPINEDDLGLLEEAAADPYIPLMTTIPRPFSEEGGRAFIERQRLKASEGKGYPFIIQDETSAKGVGFIGLWIGGEGHGRAWIGYWVALPNRGKGLALAALRAVVDWAFRETDLFRLELHIEPSNIASVRTAQSAGFQEEGLLRSWRKLGDARRDFLLYALLRSDRATAPSV